MNANDTKEVVRNANRYFWNHTDACRRAWYVAKTVEDVKRLARCAGDCIDAEKKKEAK